MSNDLTAAVAAIRTWNDGYAALRRRASDTRGWIELDSTAPDRRWPRTTGLDAIVIASLLDESYRRLDPHAAPGITARWLACKADLERDALSSLRGTYQNNRDFWSCVGALTAHLAWRAAPLPSPSAWRAVLAEVGDTPTHQLGEDIPPIWFAGVTSLDQLYAAQRRHLAQLHGVDRMEPEPDMPGAVMSVPRTTVAEVRKLAMFWTWLLWQDRSPPTVASERMLARWKAAMHELEAIETGYPHRRYEHNHTFWRALAVVAMHLATTHQIQLDDPNVRNGLSDLFGRVMGAAKEQAVREAAASSPVDTPAGARSESTGLDQPPISFRGVTDLYEVSLMQRKYLQEQRGFDWKTPEPGMTGGRMVVPRSTNADVVKLAAYWSAALSLDKSRNAIGYDHLLAEWTPVMQDIAVNARLSDPDAVYSKNHIFWRLVGKVATHTSAANAHGNSSITEFLIDVSDRFEEAPAILEEETKAALSAVGGGAKAALSAIGGGLRDIAAAGASALMGTLTKPLLIAGGVVATVLLLRNRPQSGG